MKEKEAEKIEEPKNQPAPKVDQAPKQEKKDNKLLSVPPPPIDLNESGMLAPKNSNDLYRVAAQLLKGGGVPKSYTSVEQVISAWNFAAQLKLPPQVAIRNIAIIEGTPSLFGDLPLAMVQRSGELEEFEEFIINKEYKKICYENINLGDEPFAGVVIAKRKGKTSRSYSFSVEDAKVAGLWGKTSSTGKKLTWSAYPKVMLIRRSRGMMIKSDFADILSGASICEYDFNFAPDMRDVTDSEAESGSSVLNKPSA